MTLPHRIEAILLEDGKLSLDHLPFRAGQAVEVILLPTSQSVSPSPDLCGTVVRSDLPTEPVAEADWGALH
jgi:hypothetical protein